MAVISKQPHKWLVAMKVKKYTLEIFIVLWNISLIFCRQEFGTPGTTNDIAHENSVSNAGRTTDANESMKTSKSAVPAFCAEYANKPCNELPEECLDCTYNELCVYGTKVNTSCKPRTVVKCNGEQELIKEHRCAFCYQLPESEYDCILSSNCRSNSRYQTNCSVHRDVFCLGFRVFPKFLTCNFVSGYKWSTALILSITLGGFGVDRFYLGNWQEGIGKLFSFGGLGVWTLVDIILIATGYLKPADGSRYM